MLLKENLSDNDIGRDGLPLVAHYDYSEFSPEVLCMIFEKLASNTDELQPLLNCRLVHSHKWKSAMDTVLEKKRLENWTRFPPYQNNLFDFPTVRVIAIQPVISLEWLFVPPMLADGGGLDVTKNVFPTKSLTVTFGKPSCSPLNTSYKAIGATQFFSTFGKQLTSLTLSGIPFVTFASLHGILTNTPNLKGITLDSMEIHFPMLTSHDLPPLSKLEHLHLKSLTEKGYLKEVGMAYYRPLYNRIVKPYTKQLKSLNVDCSISYLEHVPIPYQLLTQLEANFLLNASDLNPTTFPKLGHLYLKTFLGSPQPGYLYWKTLQEFLVQFSNMLVELHLDIHRRNAGGSHETEEQRRWSINRSPFPKIKSFSIIYPKMFGEKEAVTDILKSFPNLEKLNLLRFTRACPCGTTCFRNPRCHEENEEIPNESVRKLLQQEQYWTICPNLKKILVWSGDFETTPFCIICR